MFFKRVGCKCVQTFLEKPKVLQISINQAGHWLRDYVPEPKPPMTTEKILAAAEKYNLLPSEYKTFPDDGFGYGDYPNLPIESADSKDNFYPWDIPSLKRNFNEPLNVMADMIIEERLNLNQRLRKSKLRHLLEFFGWMGFLWTTYSYLNDKKMFLPLLKKQYPGDKCQTHYTFEQLPPKKNCDDCD